MYNACVSILPVGPALREHVRAITPYVEAVEPQHLDIAPPPPASPATSRAEERAGPLGALSGGRESPPPSLEYLRLHESPVFSMGVFRFPTAAVIPLHNHPNMTVVSKLLYGKIHVRSFDWVNPEEGGGEWTVPFGTPRWGAECTG